ncbi:MAG: biosynthetic peptidoglycan transglycosylase, partial [Polyangiales bacterium]
DVLGSLARFEWSGNWSALTRISLDSRDLEATDLSIKVRNLCLFEKTPNWVRVERFQEPFRHRAIEPDETVFEMVTGPGTDNWVAFEDISPFMVPAVVSHEDGGFYDHGGFAPWAIRDALVRNLREGRYVVGASTISMQLAKNLYLQREKTIARKVQEVILTWWLENALTKDQILELYLNVIEYGPSVYGLKHAAAYYFGRAPSELSPAESAYLACMLPSPKRYHVSYERSALTRSMKSRVGRLLEHMAKRERIGPEALAYGLAELEDFRFYRAGDPPQPLRVLPPLGAPEELAPELDPFEALFMAP